jgi:hypothetical protein
VGRLGQFRSKRSSEYPLVIVALPWPKRGQRQRCDGLTMTRKKKEAARCGNSAGPKHIRVDTLKYHPFRTASSPIFAVLS